MNFAGSPLQRMERILLKPQKFIVVQKSMCNLANTFKSFHNFVAVAYHIV